MEKLKFDNEIYAKLIELEEICPNAGDCRYCTESKKCGEICGKCLDPLDLLSLIQDLTDRKILKGDTD